MQISVRSHLIAGTAAVIGAGAIAMTPIAPANQALPAVQLPSAAQVGLAGFDSPLSELIGTFSSFNQWMLSADNTAAGYIALGGLTDTTGVGLAQTVLNFNSIGLIPQVVNDHAPFLTMLALNGAQTLESTMNAVTTTGLIASEAVWNLPGAFVTAAQQAASGDISGALATLQNAIVTPLVEAGQVAMDNVNYLLSNVVARSNALNQTIPALVDLVAKGTVGQASTMVGAFITVAQNVVAGISAGSAEQVWNAVVDGFLGPKGIPGTFLNLTVGAGVQATSTGIIPSVRGEIQAVVHGIATALSQTGSTPPVPPPAAAQASSSSVSALSAAASQKPAAAVESGPSVNSGSSGAGTASSSSVSALSAAASQKQKSAAAVESGPSANSGSSGAGTASSTNEKSATSHSTKSSAKSTAAHSVDSSKRTAAKSSAH
ncbi:hypothetical protein [Mycolicibacterium komossense]|uniref:PE-PGRS family protein n=1 Tax=Mycolicibacterium komossense TaxID=1779 RepID=A0ABT3C783_9MYCO|nr:hypothetical protein [Mycolicibacterium komossense]MCV7225342.1 hypothetical protein [Mycolicibacterium komossense]